MYIERHFVGGIISNIQTNNIQKQITLSIKERIK